MMLEGAPAAHPPENEFPANPGCQAGGGIDEHTPGLTAGVRQGTYFPTP